MNEYIIPRGPVPDTFILDELSEDEITDWIESCPTPMDSYPRPHFAAVGRCAFGDYVSYFIGLENGVYLCFRAGGERSDVKVYAMGGDEVFGDISLADIGLYKGEIDRLLHSIAAYDNTVVPKFSEIYGFPEFSDVSEFDRQRQLAVDRVGEIFERIFLPLEAGKIHA